MFLNFKGGKGVSCTYGLFAAIFGWKFILIWFSVWLLILFISRLMSLTNLILTILFPIFFWIKFHSFASIVIGITLTFVIFTAHKENIKKLTKGKENKI